MNKLKYFVLFVFLSMPFSFASANTETIKVGVLAKRGAEVVLQRWTALASYLESQQPEFHFVIVPLSFDEVEPAVKQHKIDFLLTNPGMFSDLSFAYKLSPIATLKRKIFGKSFIRFGSVVLTLANQTDIKSYSSLKGRHLAAVSESSFGGWVAAYREMDSADVSIGSLSALDFLGTHDSVVYAVQSGDAEVGVVRTDTLETMDSEGKIKLSDFKILPIPTSSQNAEQGDYPLLLSSRLYPEWPFVKLPHVPDEIAEDVAAALLSMPADSKAANTAKIMGWTIPQNYREVDLAYSQLGLGAYKDLVNYSIVDVVIRYWKSVLLGFFFLTTLIGTVIYIASLNKNLKATQEKLNKMVNTDGLTGLPNRIYFMALAEKYIRAAKIEKRKAVVMFLDLDKFKPINDTYGHDVGDAVLIEVSERLTEVLRLSDIVARIGGDEFLVMLWDVNSIENVELVINKLIASASAPIITKQGDEINVGCSVGVSIYSGGDETLGELIKKADLALYKVKEQGRGFFLVHQDESS